jgi:hypothetical protein
MPSTERIAGTLSVALACAALFSTGAQADSGRSCEPRPLTAAEKAAGERIAEALRKSLPTAPPGWTPHDNPPTLASGTCEEEASGNAASGKRVLLPVSVSVSRGFRREAEPAVPTAPAGAQAPAQPASNAGAQARVEALQKEIAELQGKDRAALAAYQAARRAGDSPAQKEASDTSRRHRAEMKPLQNELRVLRNEMRAKRAGAAQAETRQGQQRMQAARANRRDASVSIHANLRQQDVYPARRIDAGDAPLALRDGAGATHLFYGPWRRSGNFAVASIDESGATTRVQAVSVRIDANESMTEALLGKLDLEAVRQMVAAAPARAPLAKAAPAPMEISLQVGSNTYRSSGEGECKAASQASIYGVNASLHSVSHSAGDRSLKLSLWQPKDGAPAMMSLHVSTGSARYRVDTVKAGAKRDTQGSGKATLQSAGAGGVFSIEAVAASGEKITGTIHCGRFGGVQAEGG